MNNFRMIKTMLMNAPVSLTMAVVAQVMSIILGHSSGLNIGEMALSFVVSYIFACLPLPLFLSPCFGGSLCPQFATINT